MTEHADTCKWEEGGYPCRKYSTDGTSLGAHIAHTMGTTDEDKIVKDANGIRMFRSNVEAEQADWEATLGDKEPDVDYVYAYVADSAAPVARYAQPTQADDFLEESLEATAAHEPLPYPSSSLEWTEPRLPGTSQA